jgi:hypothetical protein
MTGTMTRSPTRYATERSSCIVPVCLGVRAYYYITAFVLIRIQLQSYLRNTVSAINNNKIHTPT